jgi:hypothetical protein
MREGLIIVPQHDNDGHSLQHVKHYAELALAKSFGGVTVNSAKGSWVNPRGELVTEPVWQMTVAYDPTPANDAKLASVARYVGHEGKQHSVYLRYADGAVQIMETAKPALQVAA